MKTVFKAFVILISLLLVCGCKKKPTKEFIITFRSNPSTGYDWQYKIKNSDLINIEQTYKEDNCSKDVIGCPGTTTFKVTGLKKGEATIYLQYKRPWEVNEDDLDATYVLTINEDLTISEKEHYGNAFDEKERNK